MNKFWKKISIVSALALAFAFLPNISFAASIPGIGELTTGFFSALTSGLQVFTETIGYAIAYITGLLIAWAAYFIQIMVNLSVTIIQSPVVAQGFKITLNLTNLGFVLAVIFIAFITIFRLQGYETKKLLKNLVIAAVLINFSFTFAGLIMDGSNIFGKFFISASLGEGNSNVEGLTMNLANALNAHKLNNTPPAADTLSATAGTADAYLKTIASISLMVLFNSMIVITFFTIAGMMLVRYIALSILLIIMPFAWLCWIFPGLAGNWKKWWNEFVKWNIFFPVLMFFIYLSLLTSNEIGKTITGNSAGLTTAGAASTLTTFGTDAIVGIAQGVVQVALLFGGLVIAQKMGIAGSDGIMKASGTVKGWVTGGAIVATKLPYYAARKVAPGFTPVKGGAQVAADFINKRLGWIPGAGAATVALNKFASRKGEVEAIRKSKFDDLTREQLKVKANLKPPRDPVERAALLEVLVKQKMVGEITKNAADQKTKDSRMTAFIDAAKKTNKEALIKDIVKLDPRLAELVMEDGKPGDVRKATSKLSPNEATGLDKDALLDSRIALGLTPGAIAAIVAQNSAEHTENLEAALSKILLSGESGGKLKKADEALAKIQIELQKLNALTKETASKAELERRNAARSQKTTLQQERLIVVQQLNPEQKVAYSQIEKVKVARGKASQYNWQPQEAGTGAAEEPKKT